MIKLKDLLFEYKDWISVVTDIITPQGEIQSTLDKSGEHNSHYGLKYHYGTKWRYNPKTKIVYWPSTNWSEQSSDDLVNVENHLYKKYGFEVKDHIDMNFKGGHKYINAAHGIVKEIIKEIHLVNEVTAEKEKQVKSFLSQMNDDNVVVTVSREDELPAASYVQVDGFVNGQNVFSSNPEDLVKWGFQIPSSQQFLTLPRGRYKLGDVKKYLRYLKIIK